MPTSSISCLGANKLFFNLVKAINEWIFRDALEICSLDKCYAVNELTKNRKETVIPSSINRKDDFHQVIENFSTFKCHDLCCTYYTFKGKISRHLKRLNEQSVDGPTAKRLNRSCVSTFDFKRNCLIRGQYCEVTPSQRSQKSYFNNNSNNNNNNSKSSNDYSNNNNINNNNTNNNRLNNKKTITIKSFKYKTKIIGSTPDNENRLNAKLAVPLK